MKTSNKLLLLFASLIVFLLIGSIIFMRFFGLETGKAVLGSGNIVTESRTVPAFTGIDVTGPFEVRLTQGPDTRLSLEGDEAFLKSLITEVMDDGILRIRVRPGFSLAINPDITVRIEGPVWHDIRLNGSAGLRAEKPILTDRLGLEANGAPEVFLPIRCDWLSVTANGSSEIRLEGQAGTLDYESSGSADLTADELKCRTVDLEISGSGEARVHADSLLNVQVSGSADVTYTGQAPVVHSRISGSGELRRE